MRVLIQRISHAQLHISGSLHCSAGRGMLAYLGVEKDDTDKDAAFIADKIINLRFFEDADGKMNLSVKETAGDIMLVTNFTLASDCRKGRRPSFDTAANPDKAVILYEKTVQLLENAGISIKKGVFAANMQITSTNDGPVNFIIDSRRNE